MVEKVTATGERVAIERQELGKGFPPLSVTPGPVTTGCGHIMHFACFEVYLNATQRRHVSQIARNHPERPDLKEFMCPLCKALGNIFLPIIWKAKKVSSTGVLETEEPFDTWLELQLVTTYKSLERTGKAPADVTHDQKVLYDYAERYFIQPVAVRLPDLLKPLLPSNTSGPRYQGLVPPFLGVQPGEVVDAGLAAASSQNSPALTPDVPMGELFKIYYRLREALKVNLIHSSFAYSHTPAATEDFTHTDVLAQALGYSIAAAEIAQRGVQSESVRGTLIDKISPQTITHLRVFSETVSSYIAIGSLRGQGLTKTMDEFSEIQRRQFRQLFVGHPSIYDPDVLSFDLKGIAPLLCQDPFIFLAECAVGVAPATNLDIHHIMRLCYLAEIVRVVHIFAMAVKTKSHNEMTHYPELLFPQPESFINAEKINNRFGSPDQMNNLLFFVCIIYNVINMGDSPASLDIDNMPIPARFKDPNFLYFMHTMISTYALPFVRKAAILMHVRYGVDLPHVSAERADEPELARLSSILRLPSLDEIFASFASRASAAHTTRSVVGGWLRHLLWVQAGNVPVKPTISLSHPAIFELVGLPKNYDTLTDEAIRRRCPTTGKELTDPALCLFCGEIMCSQAVCCMTNKNRGGCNQHLTKYVSPSISFLFLRLVLTPTRCGGQIGLFLHIRKCMILFLNLDHGTWHVAPYLDKHGEVDPALRRHHQLFLNQKRYDALLRKVWLEGGVQSLIARRLEGDVNNGGWESL
jgi:E3 ubiquitin-protein ligase UBR1